MFRFQNFILQVQTAANMPRRSGIPPEELEAMTLLNSDSIDDTYDEGTDFIATDHHWRRNLLPSS